MMKQCWVVQCHSKLSMLWRDSSGCSHPLSSPRSRQYAQLDTGSQLSLAVASGYAGMWRAWNSCFVTPSHGLAVAISWKRDCPTSVSHSWDCLRHLGRLLEQSCSACRDIKRRLCVWAKHLEATGRAVVLSVRFGSPSSFLGDADAVLPTRESVGTARRRTTISDRF